MYFYLPNITDWSLLAFHIGEFFLSHSTNEVIGTIQYSKEAWISPDYRGRSLLFLDLSTALKEVQYWIGVVQLQGGCEPQYILASVRSA
jgi:hypothetical protein